MASRAQLSQARSRARRDELLAAAIDLFAEGGARAVTHRAVAARAGLPPATTTYYFASIEELVREALSTHITSWVATLEALADVEIDPRLDLGTASDFVTSIFATRSPEKAGTELAIYLAAARDPELREAAADALRALEDLAVRFFDRLGVQAPREVAAQTVALIAGIALRRQSGPYDDAEEARLLTTAIGHLVAAHLAATPAEATATVTS
ncbi:TetR/AcrR family transcriptional regulator [Aeromicrobium sp. Leaf350]|uniref:TetR/AcrR family transcriptional regulator n=1 Tax=Aeromicrobium sp. Leaf350 TaxID=2876565 RepID=UPI001E2E988B|nr:TetR family transcriptional regulator [Aeromicrobium sp. Leaf350]